MKLHTLSNISGNTNNEEAECLTDRIVYQLSNSKYIEQGWTTVNQVQCLDDHNNNDNLLLMNDEIQSRYINSIDDILQLDFIQHEYPNGEVFLRKYNDNTGVIFYPNGNPAILFLPNETNFNNNNNNNQPPVGLLFIVHDQLAHLNLMKFKHGKKTKKNYINNNKMKKFTNIDNNNNNNVQSTTTTPTTVGQLIGVFDTNIHGVIYDKQNNIRLQYNPYEGVHFKEPLDKCTKLIKWKWSGETHVHAPPFQSLMIKLNDVITLKIYQRNNIYLYFQTMKINCKLNLVSKQLKLQWIDTTHRIKSPNK
ncbi:unnamed protein product [Schistosoma turkestanicum]|nr:unnamed protein product [Schistosoma turkestanicum]